MKSSGRAILSIAGSLSTNSNDGLTVPTAAVRQGPKGDYVWVVTPDNTAELRSVRVRQSLGGTSLIDRTRAGRAITSSSMVISACRQEAAWNIVPETTEVGIESFPVPNECFCAIHCSADRNHVVGCRRRSGRTAGLQAIVGRGIAECRLPDDRGGDSVPAGRVARCRRDLEITAPLEHYFGQISGLAVMNSVQRRRDQPDHAAVRYLDLARNIDAAARNVQSAINAASGSIVGRVAAGAADLSRGSIPPTCRC